MANLMKGFLDYLRLDSDEDDMEDYIEDYDEAAEASRAERRAKRKQEREAAAKQSATTQKSTKSTVSFDNTSRFKDNYDVKPSYDTKPKTEKRRRSYIEDTPEENVVPMRKVRTDLEISIIKPTSFAEATDISDLLLEGKAVVVNLQGYDLDEGQRIIDFICGSMYAVQGKHYQIAQYIFLFTPDSIEISSDYIDFVSGMNFNVPTLNKNF